MSEKQSILRISIISLWVGILVPIVAVLIPYAISYLTPEHDLEYEIVGPINVKGNNALTITITNNGKNLEKNLKLWIDISPYSRFEKKDLSKLLIVDTDTQFKITNEDRRVVLWLGDLRPEDKMKVSVLSEDISVTNYSRDHILGIAVKSDEHVAKHKTPSEFEKFFYPFGFWMFIILMIIMFFVGIYQEYLMPRSKREQMILKEIEKLDKK